MIDKKSKFQKLIYLLDSANIISLILLLFMLALEIFQGSVPPLVYLLIVYLPCVIGQNIKRILTEKSKEQLAPAPLKLKILWWLILVIMIILVHLQIYWEEIAGCPG